MVQYYSAFYVRVAPAFPVQIKYSSRVKIFAVVYSRIFSPGAFYVIMGIPRQKKTGASLPSTSCFHSRQTMTHGIKYQILRKCSLSYSYDDTMITIQTGNFNPFLSNCSETSLQRIYSSIISDLPFHQIQCPHCHHHGSFYLWGIYRRTFRLPDLSVSLRIQRIRCNSCGHTHALLPDWIIPYSQIRLSVCAAVIVASESGEGTESLLEEESTIDENNVAAILRSFRKHWKQRLISAGLGLSDLLSLVRGSFAHFSRQFMQIKSTPNILFSLST